MPEGSAKMKRRILGFHRRVWCPKWTPASSRSCNWGCAMPTFPGSSAAALISRATPVHRGPNAGSSGVRVACEMRFRLSVLGLRSPRLDPAADSTENRQPMTDYRLENWNRLRAPARPGFLRSTARGSRVSTPCAGRWRASAAPASARSFGLPGAQRQGLRLLRRVRMGRPRVHLQHLLHVLPRERRFGKHSPHRLLDHPLGVLGEHGLHSGETLVPHVPGVPEIALLLRLAPRQLHLLAVHHDHEISTVDVRRERRLVLAAEHLHQTAGQAAARRAGRIDHPPPTLDVFHPLRIRLHSPTRKMADANYSRGVSACQLEGSTLSRVTSGAPFSTACPGATCTAATTAARAARSSFSLFIASTTTSPAPASTRWPAATSTRTTSPGIGATTIPLPLAGRRVPVSARICRVRSSTTSTSNRCPTEPSAQRCPPSSPSPSSGCAATVQECPPSRRWCSGLPGPA